MRGPHPDTKQRNVKGVLKLCGGVTFWVKDVSLIPSLLAFKSKWWPDYAICVQRDCDGRSATKYEPGLNQDWPTHRLHEWVWQRDLFTVWHSTWDLSKHRKRTVETIQLFLRLVSKLSDSFHLRQTAKKKSDAGFVGHKGGQTPEVGGLTGMPFLPATWLKRLNLYTGTNNGNRYYFENSHPLQNLGHIVMFHGTADDFPSNILWTNWILERQGWILWENARLLKDDTRPCHFGCYAWWRFSWGQGSYNTSGECWEVEGPSLWDSVRSVRVSGVAVNESHKFTLGPALAASTFRRMPLKEESNLWRKLSSFRLCLKARSFYLDFQSNMPV